MLARSLKTFYSRGLHHLVKPSVMATQVTPLNAMAFRQFSTEGSKSDQENEDAVDETPAAPEPTPEPAAKPDMSGS